MAEKIVLDAGHGGRDYGAVYDGRKEKDDNLKLTIETGEKLKNAGFHVFYTRKADIYYTPYERAASANREEADLFLSIHRNAYSEPDQVSGIVSCIYDANGVQSEIAKKLNENLEEIGFAYQKVEIRPNLVVLRRTNMPAILLQVGYLDSEEDNRLFDESIDKIADAIVDAVLAFMKPEKKEMYHVQVGLFRIESNAEKLLQDLLAEDFSAFISFEEGYYMVLAGKFEELQEAVKLEKKLRDYAYATMIVKR